MINELSTPVDCENPWRTGYIFWLIMNQLRSCQQFGSTDGDTWGGDHYLYVQLGVAMVRISRSCNLCSTNGVPTGLAQESSSGLQQRYATWIGSRSSHRLMDNIHDMEKYVLQLLDMHYKCIWLHIYIYTCIFLYLQLFTYLHIIHIMIFIVHSISAIAGQSAWPHDFPLRWICLSFHDLPLWLHLCALLPQQLGIHSAPPGDSPLELCPSMSYPLLTIISGCKPYKTL